MYFRNATRLLTENFKNVYKIALYKIVVGLIATAFTAAIILPGLMEIWNHEATQELVLQLREFFTALFSADGAKLSDVKDGIFSDDGPFRQVVSLIASRSSGIILACVGCVLVYLVKRFVETLCYFAIGGMLNDKMTTYAETPFFTAYLSGFGRACRYALVYVPVTFLFDTLMVAVALLLLFTINVTPALFLSVTLIVLIQALKLTVTGLWMPAMIADKKRLRDAVKCENKEESKKRWKIYSTYIVVVYTIIILNVVATICTFGSALLLTIPASYMLFICQQYVYYYTIKGRKYFITYDRIASNPDKGDRAHFFDYIDETDINK